MNSANDSSVLHLMHAATALRIDGFGECTARLLHDYFQINRIWEMLRYNYASHLQYLPGFDSERANILCDNVRAVVGQVYDFEVYDALMIPGCDRNFWQTVCLDEQIWLNPEQGVNRYGKERVEAILTHFPHHDQAMMFKYFKPLRYHLVVKAAEHESGLNVY